MCGQLLADWLLNKRSLQAGLRNSCSNCCSGPLVGTCPNEGP